MCTSQAPVCGFATICELALSTQLVASRVRTDARMPWLGRDGFVIGGNGDGDIMDAALEIPHTSPHFSPELGVWWCVNRVTTLCDLIFTLAKAV